MCSTVLDDMNNLYSLDVIGKYLSFLYVTRVVARERRRGDHPPTKKCNMGDIYLVDVGRQGIRCLLVVKNGVGVAT